MKENSSQTRMMTSLRSLQLPRKPNSNLRHNTKSTKCQSNISASKGKLWWRHTSSQQFKLPGLYQSQMQLELLFLARLKSRSNNWKTRSKNYKLKTRIKTSEPLMFINKYSTMLFRQFYSSLITVGVTEQHIAIKFTNFIIGYLTPPNTKLHCGNLYE